MPACPPPHSFGFASAGARRGFDPSRPPRAGSQARANDGRSCTTAQSPRPDRRMHNRRPVASCRAGPSARGNTAHGRCAGLAPSPTPPACPAAHRGSVRRALARTLSPCAARAALRTSAAKPRSVAPRRLPQDAPGCTASTPCRRDQPDAGRQSPSAPRAALRGRLPGPIAQRTSSCLNSIGFPVSKE